MSKKLKKILLIILVLIVAVAAFLLYKKLTKKSNEPAKVEEVKKVDDIKTKEFDYILYDNKSDLYQDYFSNLKDVLLKDQVNEEEYAKTISQLFITDFYSLADKTTSTDVGGLDFVLEGIKENFVLKATDTIYKYVQSNVYGDRKQELPKVKAVTPQAVSKVSVSAAGINDANGYSVTLSVTYEKDMGFPQSVTLTLLHVEKKLFIVEVK